MTTTNAVITIAQTKNNGKGRRFVFMERTVWEKAKTGVGRTLSKKAEEIHVLDEAWVVLYKKAHSAAKKGSSLYFRGEPREILQGRLSKLVFEGVP